MKTAVDCLKTLAQYTLMRKPRALRPILQRLRNSQMSLSFGASQDCLGLLFAP